MAKSAVLKSILVGDIKITYLPDGELVADPVAIFPLSKAEDWGSYNSYLNNDGQLVLSIGAFLIESGENNILVDTGMGPPTAEVADYGDPLGGTLMDGLRQTGVSPDEVTDVVFTHLHVDHVGWTSQGQGEERVLTFPNARYFMAELEWENSSRSENEATPHLELIEAYTEMVADGFLIAPGVRVVFTPGHTPGHISLFISSGAERAYLIGDVLHSAVQLSEPEWYSKYDGNLAAAWRTREHLLGKLAQPNTLTIAGHFSDSVFGRIVLDGDNRQWEPL